MARRFRNKGTRSLPGIPQKTDSQTRVLLQALKEAVEVIAGQRGNELDTAVTWRDLIDESIVIPANPGSGLGGGVIPNTDTVFTSGTIPPDTYNLTTFAGLDFVGLSWEISSTTIVSHYEIWRNTVDDVSTATFHGVTSARVYVDFNVVEGGTYYYWVRAISYAGLPGQFQSLGGVTVTMGLQVDTVSDILTNQITELTTDGDGFVTGYKFFNTANTSAFIVKSDLFAVGFPGQTTNYPFIIGTVEGLPAIVLDAATFIADASIDNAKIGTVAAEKLFVVSGTIADALIGTGHIDNAMIGSVIQSDNYNGTAHTGWRILKSGQAEFQGITIYDNFGNAILASGTGMEWQYVSGANKPADNADVTAFNTAANIAGQGTLATQNSVTWQSQVTGSGKPANNADVTANNPQHANWLTNNVVGDHNKISAANISTYIQSLAVDTLYLAAQAVTIPSAATTAGQLDLAVGVWTDIQSIVVTTTGAPIHIHFSAYYSNYSSGSAGRVETSAYRDGTLIWSHDALEQLHETGSSSFNPSTNMPLTIFDQPAAGTYTYKIQMKEVGGAAKVRRRNLIVTELKK